MDHQLALDEQLPEKYVLGELSELERDNFEEHLSDCSRCMEEVRLAESFVANAHGVFRDEARAKVAGLPPKQERFAWWTNRQALVYSGGLNFVLAAAALYAFLTVVPLLKTEIRSLEAPVVSQSIVLQGATRGALPVFPVAKDSAVTFRLDLPKHFDRYQCSIETSAGRAQKTYNLRGVDNAETLNLTIPLAGLDPGDYRVKLSGLDDAGSDPLSSFVLHVTAGH